MNPLWIAIGRSGHLGVENLFIDNAWSVARLAKFANAKAAVISRCVQSGPASPIAIGEEVRVGR